MQEIKELFDRFLKNEQENNDFMNEMYKLAPEKKWETLFVENVNKTSLFYMDNCAIFERLEKILAKDLSEEEAETFYEQSIAMYDDRSLEYRFLVPIFDKLIPYYEKKMDYGKLVRLYVARNYEINDVKGRMFAFQEKRTEDIDRVIALKEHYTDMQNQVERAQIWVAYYIKIVLGLDTEILPPREAFAEYDEMMAYWNSDEVQKLDGDCKKIQKYLELTKSNLTDAIHTIDQEDEEIQKRFCQIARENYFIEYQKVKNEFEIDAVSYAGYLYALYLTHEKTKEEIFDDLLDFYKYGIGKFEKEEALSGEGLEFMINITRVLFRWSKEDISKERKHRMNANLISLAEMSWKQVPIGFGPILSQFMRQLFQFILSEENTDIKAEEVVYKLTIQRNFFTYMHARQVKKLTMLLFEASYALMPSLFSRYKGMSYEELAEFVENCAKIHDIGIIDMVPFRYEKNYPMTEEEEEQNRKHPVIGVKYIEEIPQLSQYRDVILGHHKHYDGMGGYPENYDNTQAFHKIITDMIFLADSIDFLFDPFMQKGNNRNFEEILQELHDGMGTKYHPMLIEVIESSKSLQEKILAAVSDDKYAAMFEYYKDLENLVIHQDIEAFANEIADMITEAQKTKKTDDVALYLDRLFEYAAREHSDLLYGKAYYYSMYYHVIREEYMNAINCGIEACRYFEKLEMYSYLSAIHNSIGLSMQCQGNPENGIGHFLQSIEYASISERKDLMGITYNNLANIFKQLELYEKAIEYFAYAEECFQEAEAYLLLLYYNILYCYIKMDNRKKVDVYWKKIQKLKEKPEEYTTYSEFSEALYDAFYDEYVHDEESFNRHLEIAASNLLVLDDYRYYIEEINLYMDLLLKLGRFEELIKQLDIYIDYCREHHIAHFILNSFMQKRIMCAYMVKDFETSRKISSYLGKVIEEQLYNQAEVTTQIENTFLKDIQRQSTRKEIIDENQQLERKVADAKNASEAKTTFLSSMSHEIRTPIHAVIGLNEMILRESKEAHIIEYAKDIQIAGNSLLNIVNDVLDFSKMEADKVEIISEKYELFELLRDLYQTYLPKAKEKNLELLFQCDESIPALLYGDMPRIKQILTNLISNAIKFTEKGKVTVIISKVLENADQISLQFHVKDTGIGVKKEEIENLLKPFERVDENRNSSIEGTGLGLSIVSMMVHKMNGHFTIDSEYGVGSEFQVELPQKVLSKETIGRVSFGGNAKETERKLIAPDARILVVDDNAVNLKVITSLLKRTKMQVETAKNGVECLELVKRQRYDIILLDHMMPEMDGLETLKRLQLDPGMNEKTPVIALTANSGSGAKEFYTSQGFRDYLPKPLDYHVMEEKIGKYLSVEFLCS